MTIATSRYRFVGLMLAVTVLVGVGGFIAGSRMKNAADAASERSAPTASPITVSVEKRDLSSTIIARGVVEYPSTIDITLGGLVGGSNERQVVTVAPAPGQTITDGNVIGQVSGRPLIVVEGDQPSYRTLRVGSAGTDVNQLEDALVRFGFDPGDVDRDYTAATASAVADWYLALGFTADGQTSRSTRAVAVPAGEIVFVPTLPGIVGEVLTPVGSTVTGPVFTMSSGPLRVRMVGNEADRELIVPGLVATMEVGTATFGGTVETVEAHQDGTLSVLLAATEPLDGELAASSAKVTISVAASNGPVLAVPIAAVSTASDGIERVSLLSAGGQVSEVEVITGLSADGYVELVSTNAVTALEEGDLLVLGWE